MLAQYTTVSQGICQIPNNLFDGYDPINDCIAKAILQYSQDRPRLMSSPFVPVPASGDDAVGYGGIAYEYDLTLLVPGPPPWNRDQFSVKRVFYPAGTIRMNVIPDQFVTTYLRADGTNHIWLRFVTMTGSLIPAPGFQVWLEYSAPHLVAVTATTTVADNPLVSNTSTVNVASTYGISAGCILTIDTEQILVGGVAESVTSTGVLWSPTQLVGCQRGVNNTTPASHSLGATVTVNSDTIQAEHPTDFYPVCNLIAAEYLQAAANKYADKAKATLKADSVDYTNKSAIYAKRAGEQRALYAAARAKVPRVNDVSFNQSTTLFGGGDRPFRRKIFGSSP